MGLALGDVKITPSDNESWIRPGDKERNIAEFIYFVNRATKDIKLVCGELDPSFYDDPQIVDAFYNFLKSDKDRKIEFIFSKESDNLKSACQDLLIENKNLFKALNKLEDWTKQVFFFWSHMRPKQHYAIVDDDASAIEEPDHKGRFDRFIKYFYDDSEINSFLKEYFTAYVDIIRDKNNVCVVK